MNKTIGNSEKLATLREGFRPLQSALKEVMGDAPLADLVYEELQSALRHGEFTPGQSLKIRPLANALGTSQTPVREALSRLVAKNALEFHPVNRSVIVPILDKAAVWEIYQIRMRVEPIAVESAAAHITKSELRGLAELRKAVERAAKANTHQQFLRRNEEFLFTTYSIGRLPRVLDIINSLWLQIGPTMGMLLVGFDRISDVAGLSGYKDLLGALRKGDGKTAGQIVERRLEQICEMICSRMD